MKKDLKVSQCFTPPELVALALSLIPPEAYRGARVLEPSAGDGAFVKALLKLPVKSVTAVELDKRYADGLEEEFGIFATIIHADFLQWAKGNYVCDSCPDFIANGCDKNPGCRDHIRRTR